jgi:catechol 2,3-dioxygenase-like lactoylglutathione lyase family enzyme
MTVSGTSHTGFSVVDLEESIAFYRWLGCEVIWEREISDEYFRQIVGIPDCVVQAAHLRVPGSDHVIELFQYDRQRSHAELMPNEPGHAHVAFLVDDLLSTYEELKAKGVRFRSPPALITAGANAGGYGVYLWDPSGITLELFQPATR